MAFWNAPVRTPRHAVVACRAVLQMQADLMQLTEQWEVKYECLPTKKVR